MELAKAFREDQKETRLDDKFLTEFVLERKNVMSMGCVI